MFSLAIPPWGIVLRTAMVYLVILVGLRLAGKREIGQMTVFDLVVLLLIANAVQNAMVGPDTSLIGGVLAALILLALNWGVAQLDLHWPRLRHLVEGSPTLLVMHGKIIPSHMRHEGLDEDTLLAALREHGITEVSDVEMAALETDGTISVIPVGSEVRRTRPLTKPLQRV
jgi:uncharacterized membrane protein YcaP (DUF421 family)